MVDAALRGRVRVTQRGERVGQIPQRAEVGAEALRRGGDLQGRLGPVDREADQAERRYGVVPGDLAPQRGVVDRTQQTSPPAGRLDSRDRRSGGRGRYNDD